MFDVSVPHFITTSEIRTRKPIKPNARKIGKRKKGAAPQYINDKDNKKDDNMKVMT